MLKKRWKIKDPVDHKMVLALADSLNISNVLSELLIRRGITNFFEAKNFFRPTIEALHDPFLMDGMEKASRRVIQAITSNEKICVYGDYDVDGTCSAALMYMFLKHFDADASIYIPNRITEGYGISEAGIDILRERGVTLIITVDCGITAVNEIAYANTLGMDTIICDHHKPKEILPPAHAVLDPQKEDDPYPFKYLSGAGVAFKLARAVGDRIGQIDLALDYLDLVALAGAADIVPLVDENRALVKKGLEAINAHPRPGIKALMKSAKMEPGNLSAGQIVFTIAPRINAVGRLGDANRAVELFTTRDEKEAEELARVLEEENHERRKIDEATFSHALDMLEETQNLEENLGIVLHNDNWHPGVIGIVASRMVEKFYRPSILLTTIDGVAKGSARSITGFNMYQALQKCEDLLIQYGGHEAAAGLAIEIDNIAEFRIRLNDILKEKLTADDVVPEINIDAKLSLSEITPKFVRVLDQFAPFGPGNMRPVFMAENVELTTIPRIVGSNHIITCMRQSKNDKIFDTIGFNLGHFVQEVDKDKNLVDIVFTIEKITRDGRLYPQLRLKDIKISENT